MSVAPRFPNIELRPMHSHHISALIVLFLSACLDGAPGPTGPGRPSIVNVRVGLNPYNALSTVLTARVANAESARVMYRAAGESVSATPFYRLQGDSLSIATLGLLPNTSYSHVIEAVGSTGGATSDTLWLATGDLPQALQGVHLTVTGASPAGYFLVAVSPPSTDSVSFIVALDGSGDVRWYRGFGRGVPVGEAKQQPNGHFTAFLGSSQGWQPTYGRYVEVLPDGEIVGTYAASLPFYTDNHEMLLTGNSDASDTVHVFGYELRHADLTFLGGPSDALVAGHAILRQTTNGEVDFYWSAWDHFALQDWIEPTGVNPPLDFDHPNSLDFDKDGNYVVSFRHMGAIVKIDSRSGAIIWQLGGRNNGFAVLNDPLGGFSAQHSVRVLDDGDLLVYDNGLRHAPPETRAVEYRIDNRARTATMVWQYRHIPALFTPYAGSVQRYKNGNTLIGFSTAGVVTEVDPAGSPLWQATLTPGYFYRITKVPSLYTYERP